MNVVIDSREQCPYTFMPPMYEGVTVETSTLSTGDYSLKGLENRVAIERKSLPDLVQCLGRERERFWRELERARGLDAFAVVVEGTWRDLATGNYNGLLNPKAACASVMAAMSRLRVPFLFAGSRANAEWCVQDFLRQYAKGLEYWARGVVKAIDDAKPKRARHTVSRGVKF